MGTCEISTCTEATKVVFCSTTFLDYGATECAIVHTLNVSLPGDKHCKNGT